MSQIELLVRNFSVPINIPGMIDERSIEYTRNATLGDVGARFVVRGSDAQLRAWRNLLRNGVRIYSPRGGLRFQGVVSEVKIALGGMQYTATLDAMTNRVKVVYMKSVLGESERTETAWLEDTKSSTDLSYGRFEKIISLGSVTQESAETQQKRQLAEFARPQWVSAPAAAQGENSATVFVTGIVPMLDTRMYQNPKGLEKNDALNGAYQNFGEGSGIAAVAQRFKINDGSSPGATSWSANKVMVWLQKEVDSVTSEPTDNVRLEVCADGWGVYGKIWGDVDNNAGLDYDDVAIRVTTDQFAIGDELRLFNPDPNPDKEEVMTVTSEPRYCGNAATAETKVWMYSVTRDPAREVGLGWSRGQYVYGRAPGAMQAYAEVAASAISSKRTIKTTFTLNQVVPMLGDTFYWLKLTRTLAATNGTWLGHGFYRAQGSTDKDYPRGVCRVYLNGNWYVDTPAWRKGVPLDMQLAFAVAGEVATDVQMAEIVKSATGLAVSCDVATASGFSTVPYRDGTRTVLAELQALMEHGVKDGRRYILKVMDDRRVVIYQEPTTDAYTVMRQDGSLADRPAHFATCGVWARSEQPVAPTGQLFGSDAFFIEEATYRAGDDRADYTAKGAPRQYVLRVFEDE